jgi:hypothetical protein
VWEAEGRAAEARAQATLILDVPTTAHIAPLRAHFAAGTWGAHFAKGSDERRVHAVFHLLGPGVLEDPTYAVFMRGFPPDVHVRVFAGSGRGGVADEGCSMS